MGVSKIDTFTFSTITADGNPPAPSAAYLGPVNGLVTAAVHGSLGGGTITFEITMDGGASWQLHTGLSLSTTNNASSLQVCAMGIRPKMTGSTSPAAIVTLGFIEY